MTEKLSPAEESSTQWEADVKYWTKFYEGQKPPRFPRLSAFGRRIGQLLFEGKSTYEGKHQRPADKVDTVQLAPQSYSGRSVANLNEHAIGTSERAFEEANQGKEWTKQRNAEERRFVIGGAIDSTEFKTKDGQTLTLATPSIPELERQQPKFGEAYYQGIRHTNIPLPPQEDIDFMPVGARAPIVPNIPPPNIHQQ